MSDNVQKVADLQQAAMTVLTTWTHLEMAMTDCLARAITQPVAIAAVILESPKNFQTRLTIFEGVMLAKAGTPDQSAEVKAICATIGKLASQRNKYAHAAIGYVGSKGPFVFPFVSLQNIPLEERSRLTLQNARDTAGRIAKAAAELSKISLPAGTQQTRH